MSASSAVGKVKSLLTGLAATDEEVAQVLLDHQSLRALVDGWTRTPQYEVALRGFFADAFQQSQVISTDLDDQTSGMHDASDPRVLQSLRESFARTAAALVAEGRPFTETMTTRRFLLTPKLAALYAFTDALLIDDDDVRTDLLVQRDPQFHFVLQSTTPTPLGESLDPSSPDYLVFYLPQLATPYDPLCPSGAIRYDQTNLASPAMGLYQTLAGLGSPQFYVRQDSGGGALHLCTPPPFPSIFAPGDYTSWRWVELRKPAPGEPVTRFWDLSALRGGASLALEIPRVGFFTTLAFLATWQTGSSNQARVTLNQTMITALGKAIDLSNTTTPRSLAALDEVHANPGTECYSCHQSLDPMRQIFRASLSLHFHQQTAPAMLALPGQFNFHGTSDEVRSLGAFGAHLAGHPMFAAAWTQKLCTWANAAACDELDPEFVRVEGAFRASGHSWTVLVRELLSSPLVTQLGRSPDGGGVTPFPIARRGQLCAALSVRLGLDDLCGLDVNTTATMAARAIGAALPTDQFQRGSERPVLPVGPSLSYRTGLENLCAAAATLAVDAGPKSRWSSASAASQTAAIDAFVRTLMGATSDRATPRLALLTGHFEAARAALLAEATGGGDHPQPQAQQQAASDALRSTFVLACLSPSIAGVGQ